MRTRYYHGKKEYTVTDGNGNFTIATNENLANGKGFVIEGEIDGEKFVATKITPDDNIYEKVKTNCAKTFSGKESLGFVIDKTMTELWPHVLEVAKKLHIAGKLNRPALIRFHGDADGICGAFAIGEIIGGKFQQQNSAVYSVRDALWDISSIGQEGKPLIILIDFGSGRESEEGLKFVKAAGIEYIVIDHHPTQTKDENILTPFKVTEDGSKYTAGYLCCEIAGIFNHSEAKELAKIACAGDKSLIMEYGQEQVKKAMVLDFLASHVSFGNNLSFYKRVMKQKELFDSIANQAEEAIEVASERALRSAKTVNGKTAIVTFSLENIVTKGEWPPSSKITTRVFDKLGNEKPIVCIGYTERSIIIRVNDGAVKKGVNATKLAEDVKKSMPDFVEGGGGHIKAGAIRPRLGFVKDVLNEIIRILG